MRRDWMKEELNTASEMMKQNGHMGFEEFCHAIEQKQPVSFELAERSRKELVKEISEILSEKAEYMRMPTCAYRIGGYTIAKDGTLTWGSDVTDAGILLQALTARGWGYSIVIDTAVTEETQPEYDVEGSHETITSKDVFMRVQSEIARRANLNPDGKRRVYSSKYALSGTVYCDHAAISTEGSSGTTGAASQRSGGVSAEFSRKMWILIAPPER